MDIQLPPLDAGSINGYHPDNLILVTLLIFAVSVLTIGVLLVKTTADSNKRHEENEKNRDEWTSKIWDRLATSLAKQVELQSHTDSELGLQGTVLDTLADDTNKNFIGIREKLATLATADQVNKSFDAITMTVEQIRTDLLKQVSARPSQPITNTITVTPGSATVDTGSEKS